MQSWKQTSKARLCLVIESTKRIVADLKRCPSAYGMTAFQVDSIKAAQNLFQSWTFDGIVLDASTFGPEVLAASPSLRPRCPTQLVLLFEECAEEKQLAGPDSGATDVMQRNASTLLIVTKLHRLVDMQRRPWPAPPADVAVGGLRRIGKDIFLSGRRLPLTPNQFSVLSL